MSDVIETEVHTAYVVGCGCANCSQGPDVATADASIDGQAGQTLNGKTIWTADQIAQYLNRTGLSWEPAPNHALQQGDTDPNVITYGFFETRTEVINNGYAYRYNGGYFGLNEYFGFAAFTDAQQDATREAMQAWDDLIAPSFVEVSADNADINFGNITNSPTTQAYARLPGTLFYLNAGVNAQVLEIAGDVWVNPLQASNLQLDEGGYGAQTLVHEAGHALGLSHPGLYNAGQAGGPITYARNAEYAQDTRAYTVMSYFQANSLPATRHFDFNISTTVYAATPLIHDIAAVQRIYGADMTTRTGHTTYGFNSNAGRDSYDFVKTPAPIMAIWDAGGTDTLDASGYATNQVIDLTPGSLSSIGGVTYDTAPTYQEVLDNRAAAGIIELPADHPFAYTEAVYNGNMAALKANPVVGTLTNNVGIAYGATIENAVGGSGSDRITGNTADNALTGNAGDDTLSGDAGADRLDGGLGADSMAGGADDDTFVVNDAGDVVIEAADAGIDTVLSSISYSLGADVENLTLLEGGADGAGNDLANILTGNAADNRLSGGAGDDRLAGGEGRDVFLGGSGDDIFVGELSTVEVVTKKGEMSLDIILDFDLDGDDRFDLGALDANTNTVDDDAFSFVGHANGGRAGELSFKTFGNINAAESALGLDLDGIDGRGAAGPVSVVFGELDGDNAADFALVLIGVRDVDASDFML